MRNRTEDTRVMDDMDDDLERLPRFISSNVPKPRRRSLYKKRDYVREDDDYYKEKLNKIYKNQDEGITCDKVEEHMKKCFYCHEKYKKNDNFTVTLDPKNILRISFQDFTFYLDATVEKGKRYNYLVTALDRLKNESEPSGPVGVQAK